MTVSDDDIANLLNEELFARRAKALFLSNAGATIAKIAEECGVSTSTVRKDLDIAKRQYLADTPDQRRAVQMSIIHDMRKANYPAMMRGDTDAANVILRGLKQEASLFGLFPKVLEVPGIDSVSAANEAAALIERIAQIDPQGLREITRGQTPLDVDTVEDSHESPTGATPYEAAQPAGYRDATDEPAEAGDPGELLGPAGDAGPDDDDDDWSNIGG
ncbi:helix-turn-helix DNA-binding protein [Mycobacterium phage Donny]|uniref:Helix-turn-helix DNA-binding protein n=1 Tax=Mycobacterium phage Donny TaxID=2530126 RepID=A0A481VRN1_9CAUD|nr:helix-turn-helix DNA-binding protein [Mycobacterium phage Donny]